ncbi:MAG TPA: iron-containing alcohol dehydrogenase family protein [Micromonosporaceae bacterium]|jgi:glycerol-1-phosphate dehydrogenase [NAD(P)+]
MPLLARTVQVPLTIQVRAGALRALPEVLTDSRISAGGEVAVVVGAGLGEEVADILRPLLRRAQLFTVVGGTVEAAEELGEKLHSAGFDAVVAVGGGRTIDTVKYAATRHGLPMVTVATSLAHDGIASPVAVLERAGATISYGAAAPYAVLVDLDYVRRGPGSRSGVGDALSNLCATADWELAHAARGEPIDGLALALSRTPAEAVLNHAGGIEDEDFLATLANALVLGGVAMAVAGTSLPCSGGCHEVAHAITATHPGAGSHGEQVALGALYCTHLRGDTVLFGRLREAFRRHGLPCTPAELGLSGEQFAAAVAAAPATRPGRYTILEHAAQSPAQIAVSVATFVDAAGS